jgi:hypothetical protein
MRPQATSSPGLTMSTDTEILAQVREYIAQMTDTQAERLSGVSRHTFRRIREGELFRLQVETRRRLEGLLQGGTPGEEMPDEILPDRLYPPEEAAFLLGSRSERGAKTLGEIPDLPYVPIGPRGGQRAYHGRDLLQWIERRKVTPHLLKAS